MEITGNSHIQGNVKMKNTRCYANVAGCEELAFRQQLTTNLVHEYDWNELFQFQAYSNEHALQSLAHLYEFLGGNIEYDKQ